MPHAHAMNASGQARSEALMIREVIKQVIRRGVRRIVVWVAGLTAGLSIGLAGAGCHSPSGGIMPSANGSITYYSTETSPKTVKLIDLRTNEELFVIDIPVGQQLTLNFDKGSGDDPVTTPDLMRYEVMEKGTRIGTLHNSMTVPNAASRRLDVFLRPAPEFAAQSPQRALRTDEVANRPDWWTPKGGPMPENKSTTLYDR